MDSLVGWLMQISGEQRNSFDRHSGNREQLRWEPLERDRLNFNVDSAVSREFDASCGALCMILLGTGSQSSLEYGDL